VTSPPSGTSYSYVSTAEGEAGTGQIGGIGGTNGSEYISDAFAAAAGDPLQFYFNYVTGDGTGSFVDYAFSELLTSADAHVAWLFTARTNPGGDASPGFGLPTNDSTLTPASTPINPGATNWSALGASSGNCYGGLGNGCGNTGWIKSIYNIGGAGDYKIRFGVTNYGDNSVDSGLAFSGVTVAGNPVTNPGGNAVPEPASWALMISGFGLVGAAMRRHSGRMPVCHA
jgi:hypothetical protein